MEQIGCTHIYYGDGKGKTTAGMGLCIRAAGYGYRVLIYQFMKDGTTSERNILDQVSGITVIEGLKEEKFSFQMTEQEKQERKAFYQEKFQQICQKANQYDLIFFDEILYTIRAGLFEEALLCDFLARKPKGLEVVLTGSAPSDSVLAWADYCSEIKKIKHPFDKGVKARKGIEK